MLEGFGFMKLDHEQLPIYAIARAALQVLWAEQNFTMSVELGGCQMRPLLYMRQTCKSQYRWP